MSAFATRSLNTLNQLMHSFLQRSRHNVITCQLIDTQSMLNKCETHVHRMLDIDCIF